MSTVLPPGTILQRMYLKDRLRARQPGRFIEVGVGEGHLSQLLLELGWEGTGYDLSAEAIASARERLAPCVAAGRLALVHGDWLDAAGDGPVDLVISCMVLEHLSEEAEARYFARCREALAPGGLVVLLVPASMQHWGIEDDIAGHLRRYTAEGLRARAEALGWHARHLAGLTYPLSNWLLPVSNALVRAKERQKLALPEQARTELSGHRKVKFKTTFPPVLGWLLNERMLYPLHRLQKRLSGHPGALVLYAELESGPGT